jgi:hypothetical protein
MTRLHNETKAGGSSLELLVEDGRAKLLAWMETKDTS